MRTSPFKVVYGVNLISLLDLAPRSFGEKPSMEASKRMEEIQKLPKPVKVKIKKSNASYQAQANKHKKRMVFNLGHLL